MTKAVYRKNLFGLRSPWCWSGGSWCLEQHLIAHTSQITDRRQREQRHTSSRKTTLAYSPQTASSRGLRIQKLMTYGGISHSNHYSLELKPEIIKKKKKRPTFFCGHSSCHALVPYFVHFCGCLFWKYWAVKVSGFEASGLVVWSASAVGGAALTWAFGVAGTPVHRSSSVPWAILRRSGALRSCSRPNSRSWSGESVHLAPDVSCCRFWNVGDPSIGPPWAPLLRASYRSEKGSRDMPYILSYHKRISLSI